MTDLELDRQDAIRRLCDAHAQDHLSLDQFENRLDRLKHAPNSATIHAIMAELDDPTDYSLVPAEPSSIADDFGPPAPVAPAESLRLTSVLGSTKRGGSWTVPLAVEAMVILGELSLDLRDAVFAADALDIDLSATLGSFTLIVPPGTQVENELEETLSSSDHSVRKSHSAPPNGLLVRVRGRALLASIEIKEKLPRGMAKVRGGFLRRLLGRHSDDRA